MVVISVLLVGLLLAGCVGSGAGETEDGFDFPEEDVSSEEAGEEFDFTGEEEAEENGSEFDFTDEDLDLDDENENIDQETAPDTEEEDPDAPPVVLSPPSKESIKDLYELDSCVVGTWVVDNQTYLSFLQDQAAESGYDEGEFTDLEGVYLVTFTEDWDVISEGVLVLEISSDQGSITSNIEYDAVGLYAVYQGDMFYFGEFNTTATFMGESSTTEGTKQRTEEEYQGSKYTCQGNTLQIDTLTYYRLEE
jgi:hypothetical protein